MNSEPASCIHGSWSSRVHKRIFKPNQHEKTPENIKKVLETNQKQKICHRIDTSAWLWYTPCTIGASIKHKLNI